MSASKGGHIIHGKRKLGLGRFHRDLEELGMRQLFDEESNSCSYLIWDKQTEDAVIIDPVQSQVARDLIVSTNLHLHYAINTHVHEDHISGTGALKKKVQGLQSVISRASGAQADLYIENGDQIHFGNRHIVALATPGHTGGCMSFLLDDGKAVITGDTLLADGYGPLLEQSGSTWSFCDSIFNKLFLLPEGCVVLPGHDYGGGLHSTIGKEKALLQHCGNTMEDVANYMNMNEYPNTPNLKKSNVMIACNMKDGAKPFHVRALRASPKQRWGIFG